MLTLTRFAVPLVAASLVGLALPPMAQAATDVRPHIINGEEAAIEDAPWQVGLLYASASDTFQAQFCGGSVISATWVVTAAHCVDTTTSPANIQVTAGTATLADEAPRYPVARIIIHTDWNAYTYENDVALLQLSTPLPIDGVTVAPIGLPTFTSWPSEGSTGLITGWGNARSQESPAYPSTLRKADIRVISGPGSDACGDYSLEADNGGYVPAIMLCAGTASAPYIDTCQGDSGGPLAVQRDGQWYLAGITSWGRGCAEPGYPGIYTRVTAFTDWIRTAQAPGATGSISVNASGSGRLACAYIYNAALDAGPVATRCTAPTTRITVPDLLPGNYLVLNAFDGIYSPDTWVSNSGVTPRRADATRVRVSAGGTTTVTNGTMAGTAMSFTLPSAAAELGNNICVYVYAVSEDVQIYNCLGREATSLTVTAVPASADGFAIYVEDATGTYASYYYTGTGQSGTVAYEQARIVSSAVNTTTSYSLTLTEAARISGFVTLGEGGDPGGEVVLAVAGVEDPVYYVDVDAEGRYLIWGLPPGTYEVGASDPQGVHRPQWWDGAASRQDATPIVLRAGDAVGGISMALTAAGAIAGTVTGPRGAALSADSDVQAVLRGADGPIVTQVGSDGTYAFTELDSGTYTLEFVDEAGIYANIYYRDASGASAATSITVTAGQVTSGIDQALTLVQRIEITGSRKGKGPRSQIVIKGTSAGLAGARVTPWIKVAGTKKFVKVRQTVKVAANGTFTWTYATPKGASVYVTSGSVRSATVTVKAAR